MAQFNLDEILGELNEAEKTAEQAFTESILADDTQKEEVSEAQVNEETASEKVAEENDTTAEASEEATSEETEEAKATEETKEAEDNSSIEGKVASIVEDKLVKVACELGKIAARTFFTELAAIGIAIPTNYDMNMVPPVSQVSQPMGSPVTVAADAKEQMKAGHDAYDKNNAHVETPAGYMKMTKKASHVTPELVRNITNKIYQGE